MNLWISASGQFHFMEMKECLSGREGKETLILMYLLHVITFFLYFCSLTSTVFVRHNVMTINLVKKCYETYSAENVG